MGAPVSMALMMASIRRTLANRSTITRSLLHGMAARCPIGRDHHVSARFHRDKAIRVEDRQQLIARVDERESDQ